MGYRASSRRKCQDDYETELEKNREEISPELFLDISTFALKYKGKRQTPPSGHPRC
jgi:hypothetical protein